MLDATQNELLLQNGICFEVAADKRREISNDHNPEVSCTISFILCALVEFKLSWSWLVLVGLGWHGLDLFGNLAWVGLGWHGLASVGLGWSRSVKYSQKKSGTTIKRLTDKY